MNEVCLSDLAHSPIWKWENCWPGTLCHFPVPSLQLQNSGLTYTNKAACPKQSRAQLLGQWGQWAFSATYSKEGLYIGQNIKCKLAIWSQFRVIRKEQMTHPLYPWNRYTHAPICILVKSLLYRCICTCLLRNVLKAAFIVVMKE